jgi:hypothetical protein
MKTILYIYLSFPQSATGTPTSLVTTQPRSAKDFTCRNFTYDTSRARSLTTRIRVTPSRMCIEIHCRFRRCGHTRFMRWDYCSVIIPADRLPKTGRTCRRYRLRYKNNQDAVNCFDCVWEQGMVGSLVEELDVSSASNEREGKSKMWDWVRRVFKVGR